MKKIYTAILFFCIICIGFIRDFFFKNINYRLGYLWKNNQTYYTETSEYLLKNLSYYELYYGKYILTVFISIFYMFFCMMLFSVHFKKNNHYLIFTIYISIISTCCLIYLLGYITGNTHAFYSLSRYIMGFVQSPVLIAILFFGFFMSTHKQ